MSVIPFPGSFHALLGGATARRAFEIADDAMTAQLECHSLHSPESPADGRRVFGLMSEAGKEVPRLAQADPALREAFEWLSSRGLARLVADRAGRDAVELASPTAGKLGEVTDPLPGLYLHVASGHEYLVFGTARSASNHRDGARDVLYFSMHHGGFATREVEEFCQVMDKGRPRFELQKPLTALQAFRMALERQGASSAGERS